jgi:hypothetical protein
MCSDRRRRALSLASFAALAAVLVACGKQGDPHPRPRPVPQPAKDLTVRQRGGDVLLEFSYPAATVAGLPLERLTSVVVYEAEVPAQSDGKVPTLREAELQSMAKPVHELLGPTLDEAIVGGKITVQRTLSPEALGAAAARVYAVRTKGPSGDLSPFSNPAGVKPRALPPPPGSLDALAQSQGIAISWTAPPGTTPRIPPAPTPAPGATSPAPAPGTTPATPAAVTAAPPATTTATEPATPAAAPAPTAETATPPPAPPPPPPATAPAATTPAPAAPTAAPTTTTAATEPATPGLLPIAGYVVLRREATNPRWGAPLAVVPPTKLEHLDRTARYGARYVYSVLTLVESDPPVESAPQSAKEVDYRDLFAPAPPTELRALLVGDAVRLVWEPSPEADLAGYWIERSEADAEFRRVNAQLVSGTDHTDPLPPGGGALRYRMVAVDAVGNASRPTEAVTVDRP